MNNKDSFGKKFINYVKSNPIVVMLVIVAIIVGFTKDNFFSWKNFGNLMSNTAVRFLIALGVSGCLITKGTDLSAGRQVGLAACLAGILILDEPTRGIDVGAKYEIYCIIADLAKQGKSIIMISSEMGELIGMSDRIMVMCDGRITGFIDGKEANQENIMALATQFE